MYKLKSLNIKKIIILCAILFFIWFTPWILFLNLGILFYFPYEKNGVDRYLRVTGPVTRIFSKTWTYGNSIPKFCKQALIASEDETFYEHYGIDLNSIKQSMERNSHSKRIKRGGSTITQQLVKNAFLSRQKSYLRKAREIEGALLLNAFMSKDSQLNWYFNVIEFGPHIYGIQEASRFYFKKDTQFLTPAQCLKLVVIIPSPKKWNKSLISKNSTLFFEERYRTILNHLRHLNIASARDLSLAEIGFPLSRE